MVLPDETLAVLTVTYNSEHLLDDFIASLNDGLKGVSLASHCG